MFTTLNLILLRALSHDFMYICNPGYMGVKTPHLGFHPSAPRKADKRKNKYDI